MGAGPYEDQRAAAVGQKVLDDRPLVAELRDRREDEVVRRVRGGRVEAVEKGVVEGLVGAEGDADGCGVLGAQGAGGLVADVAEPLGRAEDPTARLLAHPRPATKYQGDGGLGEAQLVGDVVHRGTSAR